MKKITIAIILTLCLLCALLLPACNKGGAYTYTPLNASVRYLKNIEGETVVLASGREATAENVLFLTQEVKTGDIITPPSEEPTRLGYIFKGWATDKEGTTLFDFSQPVTGSLNLYAKWEHEEGGATTLDYAEPELTFQEKIDESNEFSLTGICNQPIKDGAVDLTTVGINRLTHFATNVKTLLNYTRASATVVKSATFADGEVSVTYTAGGSDNVINIRVNDISESLEIKDDPKTKKESIDESTFETKAKRYEDPNQKGNASDSFDYYGSYEVIMGGSSSMENWSASSVYMDPATTKNVGIGGSSAAYWRDSLADRLIIPFNPRAVVLYVGINDIINYGNNGSTTANNLLGLFRHIHERLPETMIHYILINKVPNYYKSNKDAIDTANDAVIEFAKGEGKDYMNVIDAGTVLEKKTGDYSEAYFLSDGLHMSLAGYELWGAEVKKAFVAKEKELYK